MNRELVENILDVVKHATDKRVVLKGLIKLRTDLVKDHAGIKLFFDAGGVSPMVKFLTKPYEQIIEVALSILGNCCTEAACVKEALQCKVSNHLFGILKCLNNEVIQMRAFRLLGNLAKNDSPQLLANYDILTFAKDLCNTLAECKNVHVLIAGFRACRILLKYTPFLNSFLQCEGFILVLNALNKILNKEAKLITNEIIVDANKNATNQRPQKPHNHVHREEYFIEVMRNLDMHNDICDEYKETEVVERSAPANLYALPEDKLVLEQLNEVLKCLQILSYCRLANSWKTHTRKIPNIMWESTSRPDVDLKPLIYLITTDSQRSVALNIVAQLTKCCYAICWLGQAGAVKSICELLVSNDNILYRDRLNCINALSNLSNDACNRSKIRRSGVLKKLISIMQQNSNSSSETTAILYVLNNFQYDNMGLTLMLHDGLIPTLIKALNEIMNSDDGYRRERREIKFVTAKKRKITEYIDYTTKFSKFCDADSPSNSPKASVSPCSSRSISPAFSSGFPVEENAEDDDSYSPVCSDDDDDQVDNDAETNKLTANEHTAMYVDSINPILKMLDTEQHMESIDEPVSDREDEETVEFMEETAKDESKTRSNNSQLHGNNINRIEMLIFRSTLFPTKRLELGSPDTLNAIIKAIQIFGPTNHLCAALRNILMQKKFFEQVLLQGIPHKLYQMTLAQEISLVGFKFLQTLTTVGESNYGKSELVRLLNCKDVNFQERAAISIAYIIKAPGILNTFLKHSNMLNFLFKIVLNDLELNAEAVDAITCMARNSLNITVPTDVENAEEYEIFQDDSPLHENCDMRFVLHPNCTNSEEEEEGNIIVEFNKKVLCEASDVFDTMLNSDFREGHDGEIHLYSYTMNGLRYFLNLVMRHADGLLINAPTIQKNYTLLEALEMSRVYIMPDLEKSIYDLLSMRLNQSNCLSVLTWSIKNHHIQLNDMAVNYYLCANLSSDAKIALYREARHSDLSAEWETLLRDALLTRCSYRYDLILK